MFDLLFVVIVGLSTAFAVLRGGLQELSTIISLSLAGIIAWMVTPGLLGVLGLSGSFFGLIIIAAVLVGVFFVAIHIGCHLALQKFPLRGNAVTINRVGGGIFGFVRGLVLIGLGYLGFSYYLDEARQPDEVKNAITQPIAAGMASWFESFAPASTQLDGFQTDPSEDASVNENGYDRASRNTLDEIVTVATTSDADAINSEITAGDSDKIADIIGEEAQ